MLEFVRHWLRHRKSKQYILLLACLFVALVFWKFSSTEEARLENDGFSVPGEGSHPIPTPPVRRPKRPKSQHLYRANGLLEVNPNGTHPIFELVGRGETLWATKLQSASETLDEAVEEYVKRYHRFPPKGFDDWWDYVREHNVQLPDEYDSIYNKLEALWGVDPIDLRKLQADWEIKESDYTVTVGKEGGKPLQVLRNFMNSDRGKMGDKIMNQLKTLQVVEHMLPNFRAVFTPYDNPSMLKDWDLENQAREAAAARIYIDIENPPALKKGWIYGCAPNSPARQNPPDFESALPSTLSPPKTKTFIHDHRLAMDPCLHPSHLLLLGQYISHNHGPVVQRYLTPQFAACATPLHFDLLPVAPEGNENVVPKAWDEKVDERLLWRGTNTGMYHTAKSRWRQTQRIRLVSTATNLTGSINVLPPPKLGEENYAVGEGVEWRRARVNPAIMDIAFAGNPNSCEAETCKQLEDLFEWRRQMTVKEAGLYKYIVDVDGNGWSSRFRRLLASNSVVFKSTTYPEWFTDRIQPWVHYIPVSIDYSDLYDSFIFFRGDLNGEGSHDAMAKKIAAAGTSWTETFWRPEDMTAYMFRLILEYARVMSPDREAMTYKGSY